MNMHIPMSLFMQFGLEFNGKIVTVTVLKETVQVMREKSVEKDDEEKHIK